MELKELKKEYNILQKKLSQFNKSELSLDRKEYAKLSKRLALFQEIIEKIKEKENIEKLIKENEEILKESEDEELKKLAKQDIEHLKDKKKSLEEKIEEILNPKEKFTK